MGRGDCAREEVVFRKSFEDPPHCDAEVGQFVGKAQLVVPFQYAWLVFGIEDMDLLCGIDGDTNPDHTSLQVLAYFGIDFRPAVKWGPDLEYDLWHGGEVISLRKRARRHAPVTVVSDIGPAHRVRAVLRHHAGIVRDDVSEFLLLHMVAQ